MCESDGLVKLNCDGGVILPGLGKCNDWDGLTDTVDALVGGLYIILMAFLIELAGLFLKDVCRRCE